LRTTRLRSSFNCCCSVVVVPLSLPISDSIVVTLFVASDRWAAVAATLWASRLWRGQTWGQPKDAYEHRTRRCAHVPR
jgi:hypothetical protein